MSKDSEAKTIIGDGKPLKTHIVVVLDRSGSMGLIRGATVEGYNKFLSEQQKVKDDDAIFTMAMFDHEYTLVHDGIPLADVPLLTMGDYIPRGNTALLDAIGRTAHAIESKKAETGKVIFLIQTDGEENASKEFKKEDIKNLITKHRDENKWEFVFLGTTEEALHQATAIYGMSQSNVLRYASSARGIDTAFLNVTSNAAAYRSNSAVSMSFTDEQRDEANQ